MKFLIYKNKIKPNVKLIEDICMYLDKKESRCEIITEDNLNDRIKADFLIVLGGDGTILHLSTFALRNNLPILSINTGNLGFLTEFEKNEYVSALDMVLNNQYKKDNRTVLRVVFNDKTYYALNDAVIQRKYLENYTDLIVKISAYIDNNFVDDIKGDGVIISTPTGSTAYSLSAGGSILSPNIKANSMTPICAHSLSNRPIVFSTDSECLLKVKSGSVSTLSIDGKSVSDVNIGDSVYIYNCNKSISFLRKKDTNFYDKLIRKFGKGIK